MTNLEVKRVLFADIQKSALFNRKRPVNTSLFSMCQMSSR